FLIMALYGFVRYKRLRNIATLSEGGIRLYIVAVGVVALGFGLWRQITITQGRHRCIEALAQAADSHARTRILYSHSGVHIPMLYPELEAKDLTCEHLSQ